MFGASLIREQLPAFAGSLVLAETLYKFHSFALECLAFLAATWFVLDWATHRIFKRGSFRSNSEGAGPNAASTET